MSQSLQKLENSITTLADKLKEIAEIVSEEVSDEIVHQNILEKEMRPDGRKLDEIRHIECKVGILPRTHGTGLLTRGETQALTVTTLGAPGAEQIIDTIKDTVDIIDIWKPIYNFKDHSKK